MGLPDIIVKLIALVLCFVFLTAAWHKIRRIDAFAAALENYQLLPAGALLWVKWLIPVLELAGATGILFPAAAHGAALLMLGLLAAYAGAIAINLARGRHDLDCGCGGPGASQPISRWHIVSNCLLMSFAALIVTADPIVDMTLLGWTITLIAACFFIFAFQAVNQILANSLSLRSS